MAYDMPTTPIELVGMPQRQRDPVLDTPQIRAQPSPLSQQHLTPNASVSRRQRDPVLDTPQIRAQPSASKNPHTSPTQPPKGSVFGGVAAQASNMPTIVPPQRPEDDPKRQTEIRKLKRDMKILLCLLVLCVAGSVVGITIAAIAQVRINREKQS